jgi:hypothetical protein
VPDTVERAAVFCDDGDSKTPPLGETDPKHQRGTKRALLIARLIEPVDECPSVAALVSSRGRPDEDRIRSSGRLASPCRVPMCAPTRYAPPSLAALLP